MQIAPFLDSCRIVSLFPLFWFMGCAKSDVHSETKYVHNIEKVYCDDWHEGEWMPVLGDDGRLHAKLFSVNLTSKLRFPQPNLVMGFPELFIEKERWGTLCADGDCDRAGDFGEDTWFSARPIILGIEHIFRFQYKSRGVPEITDDGVIYTDGPYVAIFEIYLPGSAPNSHTSQPVRLRGGRTENGELEIINLPEAIRCDRWKQVY